MDILVVSHLYPHSNKSTNGIFVHNQVQEMKRRGHTVRVISPRPYIPDIPFFSLSGRWKEYSESPESNIVDGIQISYPKYISLPRIETLPIVTFSFRHALCRQFKRLYKTGFQPDVINAHVALPDGFASIAISQAYDIPVVTSVHGSDFHSLPGVGFRRRMIRRALTESDAVTVNSTKLRRLGREEFGTEYTFKVVPNGVPSELCKQKQTAQKPDDITDGMPTIVSVGNLIETKGHQFTIKALSTLAEQREVELIIIGDGPYRSELESLVDRMDLTDDVTLLGQVPHEMVFEYLWNADVFVLPSYQEAFGIAYIEAMYCELPVIGCKGEGPADYVTDGTNGFLVEPRMSKPLLRCLERLLDDAELRTKMAANARQSVEETYTWENNVAQMESIFNLVV